MAIKKRANKVVAAMCTMELLVSIPMAEQMTRQLNKTMPRPVNLWLNRVLIFSKRMNFLKKNLLMSCLLKVQIDKSMLLTISSMVLSP